MDGGACYLERANPRVVLIDVDLLTTHEGVEVCRLFSLVKSIKSTGALRKPIIVDSRRYLVIDGHHRLKALELLGLKTAPVVVADYLVDVTDIGNWMYIGSHRLLDHKLALTYIELVEGLCKRGDGEVVVRLGEHSFRVRVDRTDFYYALKEFNPFKALALDKVPADSLVCLRSELCIYMPKLTVEDVYKVAAKGEELPPRTTFHKTPLKKVSTLIPLRRLRVR